jgi:hypothetical protein
MKAPTDPDIEEMARRAAEWVASPEGQATIEAGLEETKDLIKKFREAERVDWETLHRPMTI